MLLQNCMKMIILLSSGVQLCRGGTGSSSATTSRQQTQLKDAGNSKVLAESPHSQIQNDVNKAMGRSFIDDDDIILPFRGKVDLDEAMHDLSSEKNVGMKAWNFLSGLARSPTFIQNTWHKQPILIRSEHCGNWIEGLFTIEKDIREVDGSYITGFKTAEILRNGTKTDTWALSPIKDNPARKTTWQDVEDAMNGGTMYFNTAGSLWKNLGGLCRLTGYSFGLPPNVNVYVTPPGCTISVPPHTDKQDVFVFQTQGAKRWRIYAPPKRSQGNDPLARGKAGDVLSFEDMGEPLIDTILQPGDFLYVPIGFPHTTDTSTLLDGVEESVYSEPSVHLTMGLDTHVWFLALAHLRWALLQRCKTSFNVNMDNDEAYWKAMECIPIGFLGGEEWRSTVTSMSKGMGVSKEFCDLVSKQLKDVMIMMEPTRWTSDEKMPTDEQISEVVQYFVGEHWWKLMTTQEALFKDVDAKSGESLIKASEGTQEQNLCMEKLGEFSNNAGLTQSFRQRRLANEKRAGGIV